LTTQFIWCQYISKSEWEAVIEFIYCYIINIGIAWFKIDTYVGLNHVLLVIVAL